ncbi:MAG: hypothetical protein RE471_05445 [Ferroplasma sp.]|uniref:hypothetical protein n=1 Tax=Ferroplasma sp. TaxID=2591003 RepID=UPI002814EEED|nr:hypothetical protein [Ferroplasma sp.]WMT50426.1 MAG: hypothetical protein RE471_05445 [Ferroplasma sp.]
MKCQVLYDKPAIDYHVKEGHISMWLDYIGEHELAESIRTQNVTDAVLDTLKQKVKDSKGNRSMKGEMQHGPGHRGKKGVRKHKEELNL